MDLSLLTVQTVIAFLLILFRISGMIVSAPLLNNPSIPAQSKIGMALALSLILFPLHSNNLVVPTDLIQFTVLGFQEIVLGLLLGFAANLVFISLQMAGEFISVQMGLSISSALDPITGTQTPTIGQLFLYFAILIFLTLNIHHALILGVHHSFEWVPLGNFLSHGGLMTERFVRLSSEMFILALMVGVPVMGIMLLTEVALGFMAKVMPQMNIFMVGLPLKVAVGLLTILVCMPYLAELLGNRYADLVQQLTRLYAT